MTSDRLLGITAIALAAAMTYAAWGYAAPVEYEPVGPRTFPLVLAAMMALAGAWLAVKPAHHVDLLRGTQARVIAACAVTIIVYAILFQLLGFVVATALMALPVGRIFGGTWRQCALTGIGMGLVLYILFDKLLDVVLPKGVLAPVFNLIGL
jgi:putative tricarboxylic transport membrane protein